MCSKIKRKCYHFYLYATSRKSQKLIHSRKNQSFPIAKISSRKTQKSLIRKIKLQQTFGATRVVCVGLWVTVSTWRCPIGPFNEFWSAALSESSARLVVEMIEIYYARSGPRLTVIVDFTDLQLLISIMTILRTGWPEPLGHSATMWKCICWMTLGMKKFYFACNSNVVSAKLKKNHDFV